MPVFRQHARQRFRIHIIELPDPLDPSRQGLWVFNAHKIFDQLCPGLVIPEPDAIGEDSLWQQDTGMGEREIANITNAIPLRRRSEAVDIAWAVLMLAAAQARQLTGQVLSVSGGFAMPR